MADLAGPSRHIAVTLNGRMITASDSSGVWSGGTAATAPSIEYAPFGIGDIERFVDLEIRINPLDASYDYSKLYFATSFDEAYDESRVICFKLRRKWEFERIRLMLPDRARGAGYLRIRLDALANTPGWVESRPVRLVDGSTDPELTRLARLQAQKEWVRAEVERSEREGRSILPHYPESLSLELTPACNLTCSHCSSHGDDAEHRMNNRSLAFSVPMLERLGHELFPHLTLVNLVGRGEPTMVSASLWDTLTRLLEEYRVLLVCVTNGYFLKRRITEAILPLIDTITVSIDGATPDVFAANRGGANLSLVLDNIAYFHDLRQKAPVARRPRLGFSWTLKRNNIHQFPDFIRMIQPFDPALLYVRHLFIFRDKDREQSLIGHPNIVNPYLREAYSLLDKTRIKLDVPPLMAGETGAY